jgi:hypothetical protein
MAIKGPAYTKTAWSFEERPVASSKLNLWDDRIEAALELAFFLLNQAWGGGSGVIRGASTHDLKTEALDPPGLSVRVQPGYAFIGGFPFKLSAAVETIDVVPPLSQGRIDLVQASVETWGVRVKTGQEAATPAPPAADAGCIAIARLHLRPGMANIRNSDDSSNGYIEDMRVFL